MHRKKHKHSNGSLFHELRQLLGYMSRRRQRQLGILLILMVASSLSEVLSLGAVLPFLSALSNPQKLLANPQLQPLFTTLQIASTTQLVTVLALFFIAIAIITNLLRITTIYLQTYLAAKIASDFACAIYKRTILQPYHFYTCHNSSDLITLLSVDVNFLGGGILIPLLSLLTNSFVVLALTCGLFIINPNVALTATVILGVAYGLIYTWRRAALLKNSQLITHHDRKQIKAVQESLGGIREVILGGTKSFFQSAYGKSNRITQQAKASNLTTSSTPRYGIEMLAMVLMGIFALNLGRDGDFSQAVPVLGSIALCANRLLPVLQQSFAALACIQGLRASLHRILLGLQRPADPLQAWVAPQAVSLEQELKFEQIWFRYNPSGEWVLRDLNLAIKPRTTVGFVGTTGSGKSTTADLILGLLQPEKGQIWLDSKPLTGERLRAWQLGIAHVPQSIFLTDATIASNIAFGIPLELIDYEQVYQAARLAQLDEFIRKLPQGYETMVGERGIRLSGGQRQRIGIARALYRKASVIVLDEATSALDNATEREVMTAIESLSNQLTIILIAHRLSTVEKCNQLFEFERGKIIASGTYEELLRSSESFRKMASQNTLEKQIQ